MKINLKYMKWVFLLFYFIILFCLFGLAYYGKLPGILGFFYDFKGKLSLILTMVLLTFLSQMIFIFVGGRINLKKPMHPGRLLLPTAIAAAMLALLFTAITVAALEAFALPGYYAVDTLWMLLLLLFINWLICAVAIYIRCRKISQYKTMSGLPKKILNASFLSLMITIPAHIYVNRRSGCFVGMYTATGVGIGVVVLLWSFGPGIILMFLQEVKKMREQNSDKQQATSDKDEQKIEV